jgi:hypothetical protein
MDELVKEEVSLLRNLNFAESYIKDCYENYNKWGKVGFLKGITDPFVARQLAELLENQRLWNEAENSSNQTWRRCSIPIVRRAFGENFLGYKLVSVQTARKAQDYIYWTSDSRIRSALSPARTRFISDVDWEQPTVAEGGFEYRGESYSVGLDVEAEATFNFSKEYSHEISREIITDLLSVCKNKECEYKGPEQLFSLIEGMSAYVGGVESNWIVASPKICEVLQPQVKDGKFAGRWDLYEFDVPNEKILLGYKNFKNHYDTGYIYSPYLPFTLLEKDNVPNGMLTRYNKKLVDANFYGSITLSNFGDDLLNYEDKSEDQ